MSASDTRSATQHQCNAPFAAQRFVQLAAKQPDAPAILTSSGTRTYGATLEAAGAVARALRDEGIGAGDLVGLYASRSEEAVLATLGIALAGAGYVPLDPTHAPEQLGFIARDLNLSFCLVQSRYADRAARDLREACRTMRIGDALGMQHGAPIAPTGPDLSDEDPAYVMYTSGTTGAPKGVMIPNRALKVYPYQDFMGFGPADVVLHHCTLAADGSVFDIWCPLLNGAALAVVEEDIPSASAVAATMRHHRVTAIGWYAGLHHVVIDHDIDAFASVRFNLSGGDRMSAPHVARLLARWPEMEVYNSFGPTETCVGALYQRITPAMAAAGETPIGRPYAGYEAFLLAADGQPAAPTPGLEGEIVIAGPTVARGYHDRPDKTATAFVADPRSGGQGMVYRTGDLARIGADGAFHHIGRVDRQMKVGGRRVELDGIEAALAAEAGVRAAAVWAVDRPGGKALRAAIQLDPAEDRTEAGECAEAAARVRSAVAAKLGAAVVPARLDVVDAMPLTPAGKIDRARLAEICDTRHRGAETRADMALSRSSISEAVARIWQDVLGCGTPPPDATFFDLGGNSLQLIEAHARLETALCREVPIAELFAAPRFADQVARVAALAGQGSEPVTTTARPAARQTSNAPDLHAIAIIGMAARLPGIRQTGSAALEAFWEALIEGRSLVSRFDACDLEDAADAETRARPDYIVARPVIEDADLFDAAYFGIRPRDAAEMDPQGRLFLELCRHALDDAGMIGTGSATAVFAASTQSTYLLNNLLADRAEIERFTSTYQLGDFARLTGNSADSLATRVAHRLGLTGPAMSLGAACSGSLVAIAQAVACLRSGQAEVALAGGVSVTFPQRRGYLAQEGGMASLDGVCRPFDARANGTVFGDGAGVIVLKPLADALRDGDPVRAVIRGVGLNNDGADKIAYTAPSVAGQAAAIAAAHRDAGLVASDIGYVECHGTATPLGDPIEIEGLARAFAGGADDCAEGACLLGAVKGNIGHSDAAAGVLGTIKTALALERKMLPPVAHFQQPNPRIAFDGTPFRVVSAPTAWDERRIAGVSSFGVGGTNAHLVLEAAMPLAEPRSDDLQAEDQQADDLQILPISARSSEALSEAVVALADTLADTLDGPHSPVLARVAATLQHGRPAEAVRLAIAASSPEEAAAALRRARVPSSGVPQTAPRVVFMLPGQGAQYPGMGAGLYTSEPVYRAVIDEGAEVLRPYLGEDIRDVLMSRSLTPEAAARALRDTRLTQPALFLTEVAVARLWEARGIVPDALIGHSVGEIAAATLSGVMAFEDGVRLIARRGQLMQDQPEGAMLCVRAPLAALEPFLGEGTDLAGRNAPNMQVVAGPFDALNALESRLEEAGIATRRLQTSHAFHSAMMTPVVAALEQEFQGLRLRAPRIPIASTVTGQWMTETQARDPAYWAGQARACVRFAEAVKTVCAGEPGVLLEVGPGDTLSTFAAQTLGRGGHGGLSQSLPDHTRIESDRQTMASACAFLWSSGVPVDWSRAGVPAHTRRVSLPGTMFQRRRHWVEAPRAQSESTGAVPASARMPDHAPSHVPTPMPETTPAVSQAGVGAPVDRSTVLEGKLLTLLSGLSGDPLSPRDAGVSFLELGYDSLFMGEVSTALDRMFGVSMTFRSLLTETPSVRALAAHLDRVLPPGAALLSDFGAEHPEATDEDADGARQSEGVPPATAHPVPGAADLEARMQAQVVAMESLVADYRRLLSAAGALTMPTEPHSGGASVSPPRPMPPPRLENLPLTENQREIWMVHQFGDMQAASFNEGLSLKLEGALDVAALKTALNDLVARHDALRMRFSRSGETFRIVPVVSVDLPFHDLSAVMPGGDRTGDEHPSDESSSNGNSRDDWAARFEALLKDEATRPMPLTEGLPFRFSLVRMARDVHVVVLTVHHIACDGWSLGTLLADLGRLYAARAAGRAPDLPPAPSFAAHALAEAGRVPDPGTLAWWTERLSDAPPLPELPLDASRTGARSYKGGTLVAEIPAAVVQRVRKVGAARGCTLYGTLFAGLQVVLSRLSGATDLIVGVPTGGQALLPDPGLVGHCVNFLPVRIPLKSGATYAEHLQAVGGHLSDAFDRRGITLGTLLRALDLPRDLRRQPLTEVQFNLERALADLDFGDLRADARGNPKAAVNFDLFFDMAEHAEGIRVTVHYNAGLYRGDTVRRWVRHLETVLIASAEDAERPMADLPLLSVAETTELVDGLNATEMELPYLDVPARIAEQARTTPHAIAVEDATAALTYAELEAHANAVAAEIQALFPEPGARIAVSLPRDRFLPAALIGVMRAGATYIPLDPAQPVPRRVQVIEAARADALLVTSETLGDAVGRPVIDARQLEWGRVPVPIAPDPERPAYVIFTSGSTGTPKGVCVPMGGLANLLSAMARAPGLSASDHLLAVTTVSFDIAALELFGPLTVGGSLRVAARDEILGTGPLTDALSSGAFTVMQATPTFWGLLMEIGVSLPRGLRVLVGGEPLPQDLAERLMAAGADLWNLYGPTETTIWSAAKRMVPGHPVTIGGPIANTELHVLDAAGRLVPPGAIGELCIGGRGLALEYFDRPDQTEAAFQEIALLGKSRRLYRTGDLARRLQDGEITLLGRRDGQVKLRGFRMELSEIEAHLRADLAVAAAAADVRGAGANARLAAWVVAREGARIDVAALSDRLAEVLPDYMVPTLWGVVGALPQTANGKLDRRALPDDAVQPLALARPAAVSSAETADVAQVGVKGSREAPRTDLWRKEGSPGDSAEQAALEDRLAAIWCEVLGCEELDRNATLYQMGADSLTVFRIAARQLADGLDLEARDVLSHPSIARLASFAAARSAPKQPRRPALADFLGGARRRTRRVG